MSESVETLKKTPIHEEHVKLGGQMVPFAGWHMPVQYTGIVDEHRAVREACGLFDVSHMGRLQLDGEHCVSVVDYLVTNDIGKLGPYQAAYTCCCNDKGTILDDLIVYKVGPERVYVVCNASNREKIVAHFTKACENHCEFQDRSEATGLLALQGPKAFDVLAKLGDSGPDLKNLKSFHFSDFDKTKLAGIPVAVARTGYTAEDGVEIFVPANEAANLWRKILEAGKEFGCKPIGLGARDTLRLEGRLSLYGNDIDETTNPIEAGLGWVVKMDKADFVGKEALAAVKSKPLPRKIAGFEMVGRGIARHGYPLCDLEGKEVGVCTSGGPSPTLGKSIGLGYLPTAMTEVGTKFQVDCRGKKIEAVVVKTPFYKRKA
ncbi:MAG TPA: glycine cleavage system aminomethyltransferase GcvT [Polyangiaceae bacterium]